MEGLFEKTVSLLTIFLLTFQVKTIEDNTYFWRPVPDFAECFWEASARAPVPLNASRIVVSSLVFTDNLLELTAVWDPPSILYGTELVRYEVRIGRNHLAPYEETEQKQYPFVKSSTMVRQKCDMHTLAGFNYGCLFLFPRITSPSARKKSTKLLRSLVCICR